MDEKKEYWRSRQYKKKKRKIVEQQSRRQQIFIQLTEETNTSISFSGSVD